MISRPRLEIDLEAIQHNFKTLQQQAPTATMTGVVKADGYGLGAIPVTQALINAGCQQFFVARLEEGIALRAQFSELKIAILDGIVPGSAAAHAEHQLVPVLNQPAELAEWAALAQNVGRRLPAMLHIETGINRLGFAASDLPPPGDPRLAAIDLRAVISHLACADDPNAAMNAAQRQRFAELSAPYEGIAKSLANSSGIFLGPNVHFDFCRPGVALYGVNPTQGRPNPMRPVVRLTAPIMQVRELDAAGTVGYGATYRVNKGAKIATVAVGYADGWLRTGSNQGAAVIAGQKVPYAGRVSMDMVNLDVSALDDHHVQRGQAVELIGGPVDVDAVAGAAGTIGYEILTSLSKRYERRYRPAEYLDTSAETEA